MIFLIDNYDSFVHNLARYLRELGWATEVRRNDAFELAELDGLAPSHVVISPGPRGPDQAGLSVEVIRRYGARLPILGVCLGHQCIGQAYGGRVVRALRPVHGKATHVRHDGRGLFAGLPNPLRAGRYHSLVVAADDLPDQLTKTAESEDGEIMALRHRVHPVFGVQFHPEAVLTEAGSGVLANFLSITEESRK